MSSVSTTVPDIGTPIFDAGGYMNPVWQNFFATLLQRTGGSAGTSPENELARLEIVEKGLSDTEKNDYAFVPINNDPPDPDLSVVAYHGIHSDPVLHDAATPSANGFMVAADKAKLDTVVAGAAVASVGATAPIVSSGGGNPVISISPATGATAGSLSASDKTKLDTLVSGAAVASVGATAPISSTGGANPNISISPASGTSAGSLSASDKSKLDTLSSPIASPSQITSDVTTGNTTADGPIVSMTLPAGVLAGTTLGFRLFGIVGVTGSGGAFNVWIKVGATKVLNQAFVAPATGFSGSGLAFEATMTIRTNGASGTLQASCMMSSQNNAFNTGPGISTASASINTTSSNTITLGWNWAAANVANTATAKNASIFVEKQ